MDNIAEIGEPCDQHHRRLADAEVYPLGIGIGHAPAGSPRQIDRVLRDCLQIDDLQYRTLLHVANTRGYADARAPDDSGAVGPWSRWEYGFDLVGRGVQPGDCRGTAIGGQDLPVISDRTRDAGEARQRCYMLLRVVIDHLDTVACGVCDENPPCFGVERRVIEVAVRLVRNFNNAKRLQRQIGFALPCGLER